MFPFTVNLPIAVVGLVLLFVGILKTVADAGKGAVIALLGLLLLFASWWYL